MPEVRIAREQDIEGFRNLWRICFGDSERFMDWFFAERYLPEFSVCLLEDDGSMMSALQSYPLHVRVRNRILPASMLTGVSTHPEREGRGYMKQIFLRYMQRVRELSIPIVIHTPAHIPTFHSRGHLPVSETLHLTQENAHGEMPEDIHLHNLYSGLAPLQACYQRATMQYSGCVTRTIADFAYKLRDYASDGAECLVRMDGDDALGYCIYSKRSDSMQAEECFATDGATLNLLIQALCHTADGRKLHIKLPPDMKVDALQAKLEIRQQGVMGLANVSETLRLIVDNPSFIFEIVDITVPQNAGIWDGSGKPSTNKPHIKIEAGRLAQFLCGYRSLQALMQEQQAQVLDEGAMRELDAAFPAQICFITDEY